ncbi:hypothetical protein COOONC_06904 [Cooperia oncophora]
MVSFLKTSMCAVPPKPTGKRSRRVPISKRFTRKSLKLSPKDSVCCLCIHAGVSHLQQLRAMSNLIVTFQTVCLARGPGSVAAVENEYDS